MLYVLSFRKLIMTALALAYVISFPSYSTTIVLPQQQQKEKSEAGLSQELEREVLSLSLIQDPESAEPLSTYVQKFLLVQPKALRSTSKANLRQ